MSDEHQAALGSAFALAIKGSSMELTYRKAVSEISGRLGAQINNELQAILTALECASAGGLEEDTDKLVDDAIAAVSRIKQLADALGGGGTK